MLAASTLRAFLKENDQPTDFENFSDEQLDATLTKFYVCARSRNGELYKGKTLQSLRYGINRYLQAPPYNRPINIMSGTAFVKSNESYKLA